MTEVRKPRQFLSLHEPLRQRWANPRGSCRAQAVAEELTIAALESIRICEILAGVATKACVFGSGRPLPISSSHAQQASSGRNPFLS